MSAARFFPGTRVLSADGIWWQEPPEWWRREPQVGTQKVPGAPPQTTAGEETLEGFLGRWAGSGAWGIRGRRLEAWRRPR